MLCHRRACRPPWSGNRALGQLAIVRIDKPLYSLHMSKIVNLRTTRKQMARTQKQRAADANAALHGRSKAERLREAQDAEKLRVHLDAHRRET